MAEAATKVLLLQMRDGTQKRITIPAGWKVTFGPLVPGSKDTAVNGSQATALRLWSGSKNAEIQHAVFTNVESFRDMSISIMEQVEEVRKDTYVKQGDASGEAIHAEVRVKKWINPDQDKPTEKEVELDRPKGALIQLR